MNQTLQLTDYIPQYVSLYYVDYRDDLDEHEDEIRELIYDRNDSDPVKDLNDLCKALHNSLYVKICVMKSLYYIF